ncbi:hypothetical protein Trydic_g16681 [Trypoxylus dichotomus]
MTRVAICKQNTLARVSEIKSMNEFSPIAGAEVGATTFNHNPPQKPPIKAPTGRKNEKRDVAARIQTEPDASCLASTAAKHRWQDCKGSLEIRQSSRVLIKQTSL